MAWNILYSTRKRFLNFIFLINLRVSFRRQILSTGLWATWCRYGLSLFLVWRQDKLQSCQNRRQYFFCGHRPTYVRLPVLVFESRMHTRIISCAMYYSQRIYVASQIWGWIYEATGKEMQQTMDLIKKFFL